MKKFIKDNIILIELLLLGYPLILILIPATFGYYLDSPLNSFWLTGFTWLLAIVLVGGVNRYLKVTILIGIVLTLVSTIPMMSLSGFSMIGSDLEVITPELRVKEVQKWENLFERKAINFNCTISHYVENSGGGDIFSFAIGGGTYVDSSIPFYKRKPNKEEERLVDGCYPSYSTFKMDEESSEFKKTKDFRN